VDPFDAHPVREFHNLYNSLHRFGQKLRQRRGLRNRPCFVGNYFLPDSRLRQRAISRTRRWGFGTATRAAGCVRRSRFKERRSLVRRSTDRADWKPPFLICAGAVPFALFHPAWLTFFVKRGDPFARFVRLTRLHVIFQREIDVFLHGMPPKLFD
jgi:hypothetical protein